MGLYLCIFADPAIDEEIDGVEVGSYDDFHGFRAAVASRLEGGHWGARFPVLMTHSDSVGEWSAEEAAALAAELLAIENEFTALPPLDFPPDTWQAAIVKSTGVKHDSLAECFMDVDGESLIVRLRNLAELAADNSCPISFQLGKHRSSTRTPAKSFLA